MEIAAIKAQSVTRIAAAGGAVGIPQLLLPVDKDGDIVALYITAKLYLTNQQPQRRSIPTALLYISIAAVCFPGFHRAGAAEKIASSSKTTALENVEQNVPIQKRVWGSLEQLWETERMVGSHEIEILP